MVTTYYLEMRSATELCPNPSPTAAFVVQQAKRPLPSLNQYFYQTVGADWGWTDRLGWTLAQWQAWVERPLLQTWLGYLDGTPCGYFELEKQQDGALDLAYFGLLPNFLGLGLGGAFLTAAIESAWAWQASRVLVNTCTLDHPAALKNYQARGVKIYKTVQR